MGDHVMRMTETMKMARNEYYETSNNPIHMKRFNSDNPAYNEWHISDSPIYTEWHFIDNLNHRVTLMTALSTEWQTSDNPVNKEWH